MALNFPNSPSDGDTYEGYVWNATVGAWQSTFTGGGGSIEASATAPENPSSGDLWWDTDNGNLYIYYNDGNSEQWVAANGPQVFVGTTAPAGYQGQLWFDSSTGKTYIYYDDGSSAQWVSAIGGSTAGSVIQVVSTTKTDTFSTSSGSYVDVTGLSASITPKSSSSKILIIADVKAAVSATAGNSVFSQISGGNASLYRGDGSGSRTRASSGSQDYRSGSHEISRSVAQIGFTFLDSPATTSTTTYAVQISSGSSATVYVNRSGDDGDVSEDGRYASSITLMEVAG